jgi:predicted RNase H-like nuclease (RuvC/YqgF family)
MSTTVAQAVESTPRVSSADPAEHVQAVAQKYFKLYETKLARQQAEHAKLKAQIDELKERIKSLKALNTRPSRIPKKPAPDASTTPADSETPSSTPVESPAKKRGGRVMKA